VFSPKGKKIAGQSAKLGGDVLLLDADSGTPLSQLPGARRVANFTGDGKRVATIDFDNVISVWDATSYRRVARLGANQTLAALSSDGVNVFAVREQAWYMDHCRACGDLTAVAHKDGLEKEAQLALRGILDNPMYEGQFSCMREQKSRR
jgi:WD40 repeat protein